MHCYYHIPLCVNIVQCVLFTECMLMKMSLTHSCSAPTAMNGSMGAGVANQPSGSMNVPTSMV